MTGTMPTWPHPVLGMTGKLRPTGSASTAISIVTLWTTPKRIRSQPAVPNRGSIVARMMQVIDTVYRNGPGAMDKTSTLANAVHFDGSKPMTSAVNSCFTQSHVRGRPKSVRPERRGLR